MSNEERKKYIKERYPDIEFKNQYFLDEKVFNDFPLEIIVTKFLQLEGMTAYQLYMHLYNYGNVDSVLSMLKYIAKENPDYFVSDDKAIYSDVNIIKEYSKIYGNREYCIDDLKEIDKINLDNNSDKSSRFVHFDISYYNELIIVQKLYKEKKIKYKDISSFIEFTFNLFKNNLIKELGNYDVKYDNYINEIISHLLIGNITPDILYECMNYYTKIKSLLIALRFGKLSYKLNKVPMDVIYALNGKVINNLCNYFFNLSELDKVKNSFTMDDIQIIITNMMCLLGLDNTDKIIKHLPQDNMKVWRLFYSFYDIDLSNVKVSGRDIIYNNDFIKFFMGNNLNEPKSLLNLIYEGKTSLYDKIESIYAYWDVLSIRYKNQPLNTRLAFLEKDFSNSKVILNPDEYLLEGDIINSYYDNRQYQGKSNLELVQNIREEYKKMKHNYQKTIPYISGEYEGYYYETLRANDPNLFIMGSASGCCFKIGGDADNFVRYCAEDVNGRVIAIKNKRGKIVAMVPLVRNGNLILCNSIESEMVRNREFMHKMVKLLEQAGNKFLDISSRVESEEDRIKIILIGDYKNEFSMFSEYKKISYGMIDDKCLFPLDSSIYVNMGGYDWDNFIVSSIDNLKLRTLRSFNPKVRYNDPRKEVFEVEKEYIDDNILKIFSSIYFEKYNKVLNIPRIEKIIFNEDWFILIDISYNIISCIVGDDPRAKEEYYEYLELTKEYSSHYDSSGNIKDSAKYSYGK